MSIRKAILELLSARAPGKTICPSEVLPDADKQNKTKMDEVRRVAAALVNEGKIEITQKGRVVDFQTVRGPIRLRLKK